MKKLLSKLTPDQRLFGAYFVGGPILFMCIVALANISGGANPRPKTYIVPTEEIVKGYPYLLNGYHCLNPKLSTHKPEDLQREDEYREMCTASEMNHKGYGSERQVDDSICTKYGGFVLDTEWFRSESKCFMTDEEWEKVPEKEYGKQYCRYSEMDGAECWIRKPFDR